jgi:hypothetical protein
LDFGRFQNGEVKIHTIQAHQTVLRLDVLWGRVVPQRQIKPNIVIVDGKEEAHREGSHCLYNDGRWLPAGDDALEAAKLKAKRLSEYEYRRTHGTLPEPKVDSKKSKTPLQEAINAYLAEN